MAFQNLKGAYMKPRVKSSVKNCSDMARDSSFKLKEVEFRIDFQEEVEDGLSLAVSKLWLNVALSNLICWEMFVPILSGVDTMVFKSRFQTKPFEDLIFYTCLVALKSMHTYKCFISYYLSEEIENNKKYNCCSIMCILIDYQLYYYSIIIKYRKANVFEI